MKFPPNLLLVAALVTLSAAYMPAKMENYLTESLLSEIESGMRRDMLASYLGIGSPKQSARSREEMGALDYELAENPLGPHPSIRDGEYLQHPPLWGHQYLSGGAGEGTQRLQPDGAIMNQKQVKTDAVLPAYCTPPNPCPVGYTAEDGCLEEFENTAAFSRDYQAAQDCMCDREHMAECPATPPATPERNDIETDIDQLVHELQVENSHKTLVAKKFHQKKSHNPYLQGEMLPVAAKKGYNIN